MIEAGWGIKETAGVRLWSGGGEKEEAVVGITVGRGVQQWHGEEMGGLQ